MSTVQTKVFNFEFVTVNASGKIIQREKKQAWYQSEKLPEGLTLDMIYIPGGTFIMGSPDTEKDRSRNEGPQHQVTIKSFYLGKYPITQRQWQAVMGNNPSMFKGDKHPVDQVLWDEAIKFCEKLAELTDKNYRLPSEAEWEYACRAGTSTPFYFGETISSDLANYRGKKVYASEPKGIARVGTTEVGLFPPNAFGLYDMHGNVREWCAEVWYENYEGAPTDGSVCQKGRGNLRVLRGGSWFVRPTHCRCAARSPFRFDRLSGNIGFRPVLSFF